MDNRSYNLLVGAVLAFVVVGIMSAIGLDIMSNVQSGFTVNSAAYNATDDAISGITKLTDYFPTIGIAVAASIVIGVVMLFAYYVRNRE